MKNTNKPTTYLMLKPEKKTPPNVIFSRLALKWIKNLVDMHNEEVGFYGVVETLPNYTFYVRDIFYPKHQLMNAGTCEISSEGEANLMNWLIEHDRMDDIQKMMLWGHSHHRMGVEPSSQDEKQAMERMESTKSSVMRIIANKDEVISVSFFDYDQQIRFNDVIWKAEQIDNEAVLEQKLTEIQTVFTSNLTSGLKVSRILEICNSDPETKRIREKIEELKKVNVPTTCFTQTVYHHDYSNYDGRSVTTHLPREFPNVKDDVTEQMKLFTHNGSFNDIVDEDNGLGNGFDETQEEVQILMERYSRF